MRGNPANHCPVSQVSILSKIIGLMYPAKIRKHSRDNGTVSDKEHKVHAEQIILDNLTAFPDKIMKLVVEGDVAKVICI